MAYLAAEYVEKQLAVSGTNLTTTKTSGRACVSKCHDNSPWQIGGNKPARRMGQRRGLPETVGRQAGVVFRLGLGRLSGVRSTRPLQEIGTGLPALHWQPCPQVETHGVKRLLLEVGVLDFGHDFLAKRWVVLIPRVSHVLDHLRLRAIARGVLAAGFAGIQRALASRLTR